MTKKTKSTIFSCSNCGYESAKWLGQCPSCQSWSSMIEVDNEIASAIQSQDDLLIVDLAKIDQHSLSRQTTGFDEFDRVLGGGLVKGSVVLMSGEPGIGKSTLLLQILANLAKTKKSVYISAEESAEQIALRANRVLKSADKNINLVSGFEVEGILNLVKKEKFEYLILDSVQTLYAEDVRGLPGGYAQVKSVASRIVNFAKKNDVTVILVGQITKEGALAGPKLLEHLVDIVLHLEGDEDRGFRVLRSLKNRFGSINEVGLFEMDEAGMHGVSDPAYYFRAKDESEKIGVCPAAIVEGNRVFIIEVQALSSSTPFSLPKRVAEGISKSKLELITAIISKHAKAYLADKDVYINLSGNFKIKDPALDLPIMLALMSSLLDKPLPKDLVVYGEVSLTGYLRPVVKQTMRDNEIKRLGYKSFTKEYSKLKRVAELKAIFKNS